MSAKVINVVVQTDPRQEEIVAELRRGRRAKRDAVVTEACATRQAGSGARSSRSAGGRSRAGAGSARAPQRRRLEARHAVLLREAAAVPEVAPIVREIQGRDLRDARVLETAVAELEQVVDAAQDGRQRQALTLDSIRRNLPPEYSVDPRSVVREADGSIRFAARNAAGRELGMVLDPARDAVVPVALEVARAGFDRIATASGTLMGCDAEQFAINELVAYMRARGTDVALVDTAPRRARGAAARREAGR